MLICILGRQPKLGLAELEAVAGANVVRPFGNICATVNTKADRLLHDTLGGTVKITEIIKPLPSSRWNKASADSFDAIESFLIGKAKESNHTLTLGMSTYGFRISPKQLWLLALAIKKKMKKEGHSVRIIVGKDCVLNSAQVLHNKLIGETGFEFSLVAAGGKAYLCKTLSVQKIDSYSKRDYGRPMRDMKVGMLPPKLAQIMLNMAKVSADEAVLDPFCGTGVVLMEAALMRADIMGSDEKRQMVDYTKANLDWLAKEYRLNLAYKLLVADATRHKWGKELDHVVTETYLGPAPSQLRDDVSLGKAVSFCNGLVKRFLVNLRPQLGKESRCCIAVPVWNSKRGPVHLPVISQLEQLGYRRATFRHADFADMVYSRPDQTVGRELLVLTVA